MPNPFRGVWDNAKQIMSPKGLTRICVVHVLTSCPCRLYKVACEISTRHQESSFHHNPSNRKLVKCSMHMVYHRRTVQLLLPETSWTQASSDQSSGFGGYAEPAASNATRQIEIDRRESSSSLKLLLMRAMFRRSPGKT